MRSDKYMGAYHIGFSRSLLLIESGCLDFELGSYLHTRSHSNLFEPHILFVKKVLNVSMSPGSHGGAASSQRAVEVLVAKLRRR